MGMAGLWIAKPTGFSEFDSVCNSKKMRENVEDLINQGQLWTEIRHRLIVDENKKRGDDDPKRHRHIDKHWYNQDEEGWWPFEPVEEIRTEALYQIIQRLKGLENPKHVSSYWMCPGGITSFRIAICESEAQLTVIVLTPPEGPTLDGEMESPHRREYLEGVRRHDGLTTDQAIPIDQSPMTLKIETRTERDAEALADRYTPGRRVVIRREGRQDFCRTILNRRVEPDGLIIELRSGSGSGSYVLDARRFGIALIERRRPPTFPALPDLGEGILLISGVGLEPTTNTEPVDSMVVGAAVRRIIDPIKQEPEDQNSSAAKSSQTVS